MSVLSFPRYMARKYCEFSGATVALAEPYFVAAFMAGAATQIGRGEKTIAQVTQRYSDTLERWVRDTLNRNMSEVDLRRAHKALLRSGIAEEAYKEGMREAGSAQPDDDYGAEDVLQVASWVDEQIGHVDSFASDVWDASGVGADEAKQENVLSRIELWIASLRNLGDQGRLFILGNIPLTLDGPDGKETCPECQRYKGQRHRRDWWEKRDLLRRNGNTNYTCGRWEGYCLHYFRDDQGEIVVA